MLYIKISVIYRLEDILKLSLIELWENMTSILFYLSIGFIESKIFLDISSLYLFSMYTKNIMTWLMTSQKEQLVWGHG